MRVRSAFNSAILFAACGLLIAVTAGAVAGDGPPRDDPLCSALSVVLENGGGDGGFTYDGTVYPADLRWTDGNLTYGCICRQRRCIRKCCRSDEVISRDLPKRPWCEKTPGHLATDATSAKTPELRLSKEQLAKEIRDIGELRHHFALLEMEDDACPGSIFSLNVNEEDGEDKVALQADGNLFVESLDRIVPPWDYCFGWKTSLDKVGILICLNSKNIQASAEQNTAHMVGIIISIPFLFATFLVYAITPELRNLYGKTLMCYVFCLITAYAFLSLVNYVYISPQFLCAIIGERAIAPRLPHTSSRSRESVLTYSSKNRGGNQARRESHTLQKRKIRWFQGNGPD